MKFVKNMNYLAAILLVLVFSAVMGCANNSEITPNFEAFELSDENRLSINKVNIRVFKPAEPPSIFFPEFQDILGSVVISKSHNVVYDGASGHHVIENIKIQSKQIEYVNYWHANSIYINEILDAEIRHQLAVSASLQLCSYENADTILDIYVHSYGFSPIERGSAYQQPFIYLEVHVKNKNDELMAVLHVSSEKYTNPEYAMLNFPILSEVEIYDKVDDVKNALELVSRIAVSNVATELVEN